MAVRYGKKVANVVISAALATSLCPAAFAFADGEEPVEQLAAEAAADALEQASEQVIIEEILDAPSGVSASMQDDLDVLEADAVATAKQLIADLPLTSTYTEKPQQYRAQVLEAEAAYEALSVDERASIDKCYPAADGLASISDQPYGRIIEAAKWARLAMEPYAATTALQDGTYDANTTPALTSEYSKGQSTSSRQKPWSILDITVKDGQVTGTITVESIYYDFIKIGGEKFENVAEAGKNSTFANVPIALNEAMYFTGNTTAMTVPYEVAFTLTAFIDESYGQNAGNIEDVKALINALPDVPSITSAQAGTYDAQIAEAGAAYDALSEADQAALDTQTCSVSNQPYGRVLESAQWALETLKPADNRTTLPNGLYNADSFPSLTSEYSKGKSTSSRQRPWIVKDVRVVNGKATGTVMVESSSYTYIYMAGKRFENKAKEGEYSTFTNVPIDLNSTMYLAGYSTSMLTEIAFSLTTSIQEPEPVDPDPDKPETDPLVEAKAAIALLPANPHKVTNADVDAIAATLKLYEALSDEDKAALEKETLSNGYTYARAVEVASWALQSLAPVDNTTTLVDGTYTLAKTDMVSDLGSSDSRRQNNWHVEKIMVENGRAFALIVRDGGNTAADTLYIGGTYLKNAATDGSSQFVIPLDLNSDMYFSVLSKNAVDGTNALAYHLNTAFDEENSVPDSVDPSDPASGDDQNGSENAPNNTGTVTAVGTGATLGAAQAAAAKNAAAAATTAAEKAAATTAAGGEGAASALEALEDIEIPVVAVGGGFAGVALLGGASFWALFRKREEHEE